MYLLKQQQRLTIVKKKQKKQLINKYTVKTDKRQTNLKTLIPQHMLQKKMRRSN